MYNKVGTSNLIRCLLARLSSRKSWHVARYAKVRCTKNFYRGWGTVKVDKTFNRVQDHHMQADTTIHLVIYVCKQNFRALRLSLENFCQRHRGQWSERTLLSGQKILFNEGASSGAATNRSDLFADNRFWAMNLWSVQQGLRSSFFELPRDRSGCAELPGTVVDTYVS